MIQNQYNDLLILDVYTWKKGKEVVMVNAVAGEADHFVRRAQEAT